MQDNEKKYRGEQEQRRHQDQRHNQKIKPAPWWIFSARIDYGHRGGRRADCTGGSICISGRGWSDEDTIGFVYSMRSRSFP